MGEKFINEFSVGLKDSGNINIKRKKIFIIFCKFVILCLLFGSFFF